MKATFVDFEDSFSYNVVQELVEAGLEVKVINWRDYEENPDGGLLVIGPGPGHPDDYQALYPLIKEWLDQKKPFFGVCLGHQIFWRLHNEEVLRSKNPLHGQKVKLNLTERWKKFFGVVEPVFVQRYNSLAVLSQAGARNPYIETFIQDDEILISKTPYAITYQFHPESIGTSFRKEFIKVLYSIMRE